MRLLFHVSFNVLSYNLFFTKWNSLVMWDFALKFIGNHSLISVNCKETFTLTKCLLIVVQFSMFCSFGIPLHAIIMFYLFQVRSLTLDVRAWDPSVINLFQSLGNTFANSVWEELLPSRNGTCENDTR